MKKNVRVKITKEDFEEFKAHCRKWIDLLNLHDHDFRIYQVPLEKDSIAIFSYDYASRVVDIILATERNDVPGFEVDLDKLAFHEVFEASLSRLTAMAESRDEKMDLEAERHALVYRVWNCITNTRLISDSKEILKSVVDKELKS